jgi:hypothetical protein
MPARPFFILLKGARAGAAAVIVESALFVGGLSWVFGTVLEHTWARLASSRDFR